MVGLQIYDTLGVVTTRFFDAEHTALAAGKFQANPKDTVSTGKPLGFTGCSLATDSDEVVLIQKAQGKKIEVVDLTAADRAQKYVEHRARGAYIASICQSKASFNLSTAAQVQQPADADYEGLNKRLQRQADNLQRRIWNVALDLSMAKLMVFTDGLSANNKDLSSQLQLSATLCITVVPTDDQSGDVLGATRSRSNGSMLRFVLGRGAASTDVLICADGDNVITLAEQIFQVVQLYTHPVHVLDTI